MTKQKVTLGIDKHLLSLARMRNTNLSQLLESAIMYDLRIKKVITYVQEIEAY